MIYMIHEINDNIMSKILWISKNEPESILTFDDGLYSNYLYKDELNKIPNKKIFFISMGIIRPDDIYPNKEFITCSDAHELFFTKNDRSNYLSILEIAKLEQLKNSKIGLHGYKHLWMDTENTYPRTIKLKNKIYSNLSLKESIKILLEDVSKMYYNQTIFFNSIFSNYREIDFCFPYNIENKIYEQLIINKNPLKNKINFYGKNRKDINNVK